MMANFTMERFGEWVAAICVLSILSLLWKENKFYRTGEHILLGLTVGFGVVATWNDLLKPKWFEPWMQSIEQTHVNGILVGTFALLLGICWYGLYHQKTEWLMRLVMGIVIGASAGQALKNNFTQQMPIVTSSFKSPVVIQDQQVHLSASINNTIFLVALVTVLLYFFFIFEQKSPTMKAAAKIGRFWLMVALGAFFGNTIMTRLSVLIERVWFVVHDFVGGFFS